MISQNGESDSDYESWNVQPSEVSVNTINPIRNIVENLKATPNPEKEVISLALGDPSVFGNFEPPKEAVEAIVEVVQGGKHNGYFASFGMQCAREAVADHINSPTGQHQVTAADIYLSCGCSDALNLAITVLANSGDNILLPRPGFSIYKTFCGSLGVETRLYNCLPEKSWEADLCQMESLINKRTKAIVVVNPSNPCGSNFSQDHIVNILKVAEKFKVPIIADEIYADMVFSGQKFYSTASLSKTVPVLECGGLAKQFLVPGWRMGWVAVHDRQGVFGEKVRRGLLSLSQRILGPCTLVQAALPSILKNTPKSFFKETMEKLENAANTIYKELAKIDGLYPVKPEGAMYMMVGFDTMMFPDIKNDLDFTEKLISEQSVKCLPAKCFEFPNYFRLVLTVPTEKILEACERIAQFCAAHRR